MVAATVVARRGSGRAPVLPRAAVLLAALALVVPGPAPGPSRLAAADRPVLRLATTTSTADSGLLAALLPEFERECGCRVAVIAVGTGQALELARRGDADVVLAHNRAEEDRFVRDGLGRRRSAVMYNDFVIVGPAADPAGVGQQRAARDAFAAIARAGAPFASRGDRSGTHSKELSLWASAGITPGPGLRGYASVGQGMGETLLLANERGAYTLCDRATWLTTRTRVPALRLLLGGDSIEHNPDRSLRNDYGLIVVAAGPRPAEQQRLAERFETWLCSAATQRRIGEFGRQSHGQALFHPDSDELKATREIEVHVGGRQRTSTLNDLEALPRRTLRSHEVIGVKRGPLGSSTWTGASLADVLSAVDPGVVAPKRSSARIVIESSDGWLATVKWAEVFGTLPPAEALYYAKGCNECHGTDGEGTRAGRADAVPPLRERRFDVAATVAMIHGAVGAHAGLEAYTAARVSRQEIASILEYLSGSPADPRAAPGEGRIPARPILLCYERDGRPMTGADGLIQLVVAADEFASRYSHWVASIRVETAAATPGGRRPR